MGKTLGDAVKGVFGRGKSERKNDSSNNYNVGPVLERLEDRTLLSGVTPSDSMAADAYAVNDSAVVVNYDSSGDAKVEDPNALVVIDVPIMSGADVMYAIYGDYDATATSGVDNVSNLGFTVDGDSNDTNKYSMVFFKGDNP
ncbi:hypothetical protein HN997_03450, partial [archaeon]|nr:hypothetical protein [archaeon]